MFAKIFQSGKYGQLLVLMQPADDNCPEVRIFAKPEGLGVSSLAFGYHDTDQGWDDCEKCFERVGLSEAEKYIGPVFEMANKHKPN